MNAAGLRPDLAIIADHIPAEARVIDVGCGDGDLMAALRDQKGVDARGIEISRDGVAAAVARGLAVVQGDADTDLADYPSDSFDFAILSQTLQTTRRPDWVMEQMLRIAPRAFVSFPNFGHWRIRLALLCGGRMPVTRLLPLSWYETPNIHQLTVRDFEIFVAERDMAIERAWFLAQGHRRGAGAANLRAEHAIYLIRRDV
jgi:methionine biosynthesis protein MetW